VDSPSLIVRDQQRSVGERKHIYRPAPMAVALQPTSDEDPRSSRGLPTLYRNPHDLVSDRRGPIPRPVLGHEERPAIGLGKRAATVEREAQRCRMRLQLHRRANDAMVAPAL